MSVKYNAHSVVQVFRGVEALFSTWDLNNVSLSMPVIIFIFRFVTVPKLSKKWLIFAYSYVKPNAHHKVAVKI